MVYRTLHTYIFRELLKIFFLTASALTTLLAFGGTFKPFTKLGIDVQQIMSILSNLMLAMLPYAIPISALFAAVLVYWRMSTDNELTACRAGGVSFMAIVMPAFALGLTVAVVDLGFVNYVVPKFLQRAERAVMRDLGSIIVSQIGRQEKFEYGNWIVYADSAELQPSDDPNLSIVKLQGAAVTILESGKPAMNAFARESTVTIRNLPEQEASEMTIDVQDASVFSPDPKNGFQRAQGGGNTGMFFDRPIPVPSQLRTKAKFLNRTELVRLMVAPWLFPPIAESVKKVADLEQYEEMERRLLEMWDGARKAGKPLEFAQTSLGAKATNRIQVFATKGEMTPGANLDKALTFTGPGMPGNRARVEQYVNGTWQSTYTCDEVGTQLSMDELSGTGVGLVLNLRGHVQRVDHARNLPTLSPGSVPLSGIVLPEGLANTVPPDAEKLVELANNSDVVAMKILAAEIDLKKGKLFQTIHSELHSRGSFSLSCLTLVLFGAALGILLRGKNPLAVFVLGFVPAIFLVLLITAGRELAEGNAKNETTGLVMIWLGNGVLLALVAGVYAKLLRH